MTRLLHGATRRFFYPAIVIASTVAIAGTHHVGNAAAATSKHHDPIAHIAVGLKGASKHHEPIAHIAKGFMGAK